MSYKLIQLDKKNKKEYSKEINTFNKAITFLTDNHIKRIYNNITDKESLNAKMYLSKILGYKLIVEYI